MGWLEVMGLVQPTEQLAPTGNGTTNVDGGGNSKRKGLKLWLYEIK